MPLVRTKSTDLKTRTRTEKSSWIASIVGGNRRDRVINALRLERNARNLETQITWQKYVGKKILALKKRKKNVSIK